ncbi:MAG: type I-MYXAN CRISPR-associated endonuclease Cas1 [Planctomycetaceae bacterium]|nr:type I-MYXAN CRISPR-associated endonuclease Cas1 [Planctomycetaceae bacterium]
MSVEAVVPVAAASSSADAPPLRVMALHALLYCERLFYLEEVEEIRVADAAVYAGRRLHDEIASPDDETPEKRSVEVASDVWNLRGKVDAVRRRDGAWVAIEHKRGRAKKGDDGSTLPWPSDRVQAIAYAVLLEEHFGEPVPQARIRYHADNKTAFVTIDDEARDELRAAIVRADQLRQSVDRPPVTDNERLCARCSLAPVCLPEEERLAASADPEKPAATPTIVPSRRDKQTLHITADRASIGRSGESLVIRSEDTGTVKVPIESVDGIVLHGYGQVTTQAVHLLSWKGVGLDWVSRGGKFQGGLTTSSGRVQQRIRQYRGLTDDELCLKLARRLVHAKVENQLRYLLRSTRGDESRRKEVQVPIDRIRESLRKLPLARSIDTLRGLEGIAAKGYFAALPSMLTPSVPPELHPNGRSKHPPRDRFNCLLSFGYALVHSLLHRTIAAVGLEPAFGFFHTPRSAAPPLVLDLMELFRTPLWEMPLVGSVNRGQWNAADDFDVAKDHVWLSDGGRKKAIGLFEERLKESYRHPHLGKSLTYDRMVELEVRLLEKEWSGAPDLFARWRLR